MKVFFARYSRSLKAPFRYGEKSLSVREGLCLRLEAPGGTLYAEASPLPGSSREKIEQIEEILRIASGYSLYEAVMDDAPVAADLPPALRFALEGFGAQSGPLKGKAASNALVAWEGPGKTREAILTKQAEGFHTVKLKVFNESVDAQLELIASLPGLRFRLDANRSLTEEALSRLFSGLEKIGPEKVEYLEEPLSHWRKPILARSPVPLAADECAADPRFWRALLPSPASVFVLKPTIAGGLSSLAKKARLLEEAGKRVVYTSSFEAEPGRRALIAFLLSLDSPSLAGIATGFLFEDSFLEDRPHWEEAPTISPREHAWLENLPWKESP
jgi:o-succinylbenzoate synthase